VGTACLGNVPSLLDHVGSAGGKVCSQSRSEFSDPEHFQLIFCVLVGQVRGRSIQVPAQGVAAEISMYICSSLTSGAE